MAKNFMEHITPITNDSSESKYLEMLNSEVYSTENIEVKTDLSQEQINAMAKMVSFAEYFKIPVLESFSNNYMKLQVSKDRKGRGEFTQIATSANGTPQEEVNTFQKFTGLK